MRTRHLIVTLLIGCGSESKPAPAPAEPAVATPVPVTPDAAAVAGPATPPDAAVEEEGGVLGDVVGELPAGSAMTGSGTSAGGSTVASKGTQRYGTLGHGTGTGTGNSGGGAPRRRPACVPTVGLGNPTANGDLDKAIIRRYIKRNLPRISYCYEKQLLASPTLEGTLRAQFFIGPAGTVTSSTAQGVYPEVASCVANVIRAIEFPKPKGGGGVQVSYPFTMRSTCP